MGRPNLPWRVLREGDTLMAICAIDYDIVADSGKIVPDDRIAG